VGARVWEKNGEAVSEKELRVSGHADAIIGEAVEENDGVVVAGMGTDDPSAEGDGIGRGDGNICEIRIELVSEVMHGGFVFRG